MELWSRLHGRYNIHMIRKLTTFDTLTMVFLKRCDLSAPGLEELAKLIDLLVLTETSGVLPDMQKCMNEGTRILQELSEDLKTWILETNQPELRATRLEPTDDLSRKVTKIVECLLKSSAEEESFHPELWEARTKYMQDSHGGGCSGCKLKVILNQLKRDVRAWLDKQ